MLVKVHEAQATTDIQATEPEDWEDIENISDRSDSSSSEEDEPVPPSKSLFPFIRPSLSQTMFPSYLTFTFTLTSHGIYIAFSIRTTPKRRPPPPAKKGNLSKRMRKVVEIPKDEDGRPILPIQIGSFQLVSIGKVELRDGYYNERYIWPVGYCIKRYEACVEAL